METPHVRPRQESRHVMSCLQEAHARPGCAAPLRWPVCPPTATTPSHSGREGCSNVLDEVGGFLMVGIKLLAEPCRWLQIFDLAHVVEQGIQSCLDGCPRGLVVVWPCRCDNGLQHRFGFFCPPNLVLDGRARVRSVHEEVLDRRWVVESCVECFQPIGGASRVHEPGEFPGGLFDDEDSRSGHLDQAREDLAL